MIEVVIHDKHTTEILNIVYELRELGLVQGQDFSFAYHMFTPEYDGFNGESPNKHTIFQFKEEALASWFRLKYIL